MNQHLPNIVVGHAEPSDADAIWRIFNGVQATAGTLQLPFPSLEPCKNAISSIFVYRRTCSHTIFRCHGFNRIRFAITALFPFVRLISSTLPLRRCPPLSAYKA
jgi:hypothetical protein